MPVRNVKIYTPCKFLLLATLSVLNDKKNLHKIATAILKVHTKTNADNTTLKFLQKQHEEVYIASLNIVKAIEQGIITKMTKTRLTDLEKQLNQFDFDISREKQRIHATLSVEQIEAFLNSQLIDNAKDIKVRKLLVNTFIREIILYPDKLLITYNFTEPIEPVKVNAETTEELERQLNTASSFTLGSSTLPYGVPLIT